MCDSESQSGSDISQPSTDATNEHLYNYDQCIAALEGTRVPDDLTSATARCAVIRGLRCSYDFTMNPVMIDLCGSSRFPEFTRARNARLIMSNVVPDGLEITEAQPYCIWNPDFAEEDTYRRVAQRYPSMRYQVGRASAAAGYINLYRELNLLPDVSIAEEAREGNTEGGNQIYQLIMSSPLKYAVMDDFERSINSENPPAPAFLNGDTHVRWKLEWRFTLEEDSIEEFLPEEIDIEEDRYMGLEYSEPDQSRYDNFTPQEATLLWEPLPLDLPTLKKDLLRQMAAYEGNLDRYNRLMNSRSRKEMGETEARCVVRGIYHNTMFARWWQHNLDTDAVRLKDADWYDVQTAINARRVMINDIGTFTEDTPCKPWLIWWPLKPELSALINLAKRCPSMHVQIAIAAIYCDYRGLYESLNVRPSAGPTEAAEQVGNSFYREDLEKRAKELGINPANEEPVIYSGDETHATLALDMEPTGVGVYTRLRADLMDQRFEGYYTRRIPFGGYVERYVWLSFETIRKIVCEYGPDGYFIGNDTRWFETHEISKDENGNDIMYDSDEEKPEGDDSSSKQTN
ncbi:unnamed protein product [Penicillium egyptiacum]|uniref:Uncharacterized protein n=1 Tax=Penicillium egyptiacum TaxID=1303716 RepID=A0A9W4P445_9EURO|nr:unnamed protein product [Penicillium egyptiacum]